MGTEDCRNWDYKDHPGASSVVKTSEELAVQIRAQPRSQNGILSDTRYWHRALFKRAVPEGCLYLAGNYRGSDFECLRVCNVGMGSRQGEHFSRVAGAMEQFHVDLAAVKNGLDSGSARLERPQLAVALAKATAWTLSTFQLIHPYANGNGHVARLLAWVLMANYDLLPVRWWVHQKPGWDELVAQYQDGETKGLELFILKTLSDGGS